MIIGIGVDTAEIARVEKSMQRQHFIDKVFGSQEKVYLDNLSGAGKYQSAAAMWAAKEAFGKAFGCGITGFAMTDVQVLHTPEGAPFFALTGQAGVLAKGLQVHLSLTHEGGFATAFAVAEQP